MLRQRYKGYVRSSLFILLRMRTWLYLVLALAALQFAGLSPFGAAYSLVGRTVGLALPRTEHDTCDDSIVTAMKNVTTDFNQVRTCSEAERCLAHATNIGVR